MPPGGASVMSIVDAQKEFIDAAIRQGDSTELGDSKAANAAFDRKTAARRALGSCTDRGATVFRSLLGHPHANVRLSAATSLLPLDEEKATAALESIAQLPGFVGFNAEIVLEEWRAGRLQLP